MNTHHERTLAAIERQALTEGVPQAETDSYIADELRIPYDHYVAYLLVWGAIEAYGLANLGRSSLHVVDPGPDDGQPRVPASLRRLFETAGAIHEAAVNAGENRVVIREQARDLISELVALAEVLLAQPALDSDHMLRHGDGGAA